MEIFFPGLIHIQSSQNVNHKRSPIWCIKDQCQSARKGHRTNRRDQLPQLCMLPNWEHVIPVSPGAHSKPGTCSSNQPTSPCPPQCHSKHIQEPSTSVCTEIPVHSPLRIMTLGITAYPPWNTYILAWDTQEAWAICHCHTKHKATLHMTKYCK